MRSNLMREAPDGRADDRHAHAGDSMVAGMAVTVARGDDVLTALKLATVAGAAAATAVGTGQGAAADVAGLVGPVEIEVLK